MSEDLADPFLVALRRPERTQIPRTTLDLPPAPSPNALVLVMIDCTCSQCGFQMLYPGRNLMLRFGRNFTRSDAGFTLHADLPREVMIVEERVLACDQCFGYSGSPPIHRGPQLPPLSSRLQNGREP